MSAAARRHLRHPFKARELFEVAPEFVVGTAVALDLEGRVRLWNQAAEQLFGYPQRDALGRTLATLTHPEDLPDRDRASDARALVGQTTAATETIRRHLRPTISSTCVLVGQLPHHCRPSSIRLLRGALEFR